MCSSQSELWSVDDFDLVAGLHAEDLSDGVVGPLGAYIGAPILLSRDASVSITAKYSNEAGITSGVVLGGPALISDDSVRKIFSMKADDEIKVIN